MHADNAIFHLHRDVGAEGFLCFLASLLSIFRVLRELRGFEPLTLSTGPCARLTPIILLLIGGVSVVLVYINNERFARRGVGFVFADARGPCAILAGKNALAIGTGFTLTR